VFISPRTWEEDSGPSPSATPASWQSFMADPPYTKVLLDLHKCAVDGQQHSGTRYPLLLLPACT
jgi:hypothetical protein